MSDHIWVAMQYTPLEIEELPDGTLNVSATESAIEVSVEEALYGCWMCHTPLDTESYHTECSAEESPTPN